MNERASSSLRHGVHVPNLGPYGDPNLLVTLAVEAEEAGWDGLFVWDHVLHRLNERRPVVNPWVTLGACAVRTERIRLGALITPLSRRRPWNVARETVALDLLSNGRAVFGAGLGSPRDSEFEAFGEEADDRRRAARLDEGLEILVALWSGEPVAHSGEHYAFDEVQFVPTAVQERIPIWIGGNWPNRRPFRRAARWDGVVPEKVGNELVTPADVRDLIGFISEERATAGIDPRRPFDVVCAGLTDAPDARGAEITGEYAAAGATWWLERFHPERCSVDNARRRIQAGPAR